MPMQRDFWKKLNSKLQLHQGEGEQGLKIQYVKGIPTTVKKCNKFLSLILWTLLCTLSVFMYMNLNSIEAKYNDLQLLVKMHQPAFR